MVKVGIVTSASSAWSFPIVIATKMDGKPRFCVYYGRFIERMTAHWWPIPEQQELFDDLVGSMVFSMLDLFCGYCQIRLTE